MSALDIKGMPREEGSGSVGEKRVGNARSVRVYIVLINPGSCMGFLQIRRHIGLRPIVSTTVVGAQHCLNCYLSRRLF